MDLRLSQGWRYLKISPSLMAYWGAGNVNVWRKQTDDSPTYDIRRWQNVRTSYVGAELVTQLDGEAGAISDLPSGTVCTVSVAHLLWSSRHIAAMKVWQICFLDYSTRCSHLCLPVCLLLLKNGLQSGIQVQTDVFQPHLRSQSFPIILQSTL